ncbi:MAG TPA: BatD family protein [Phototrophicaceae bacterium]|nr:BatD family protein [Phototrophicaceae bacterium]
MVKRLVMMGLLALVLAVISRVSAQETAAPDYWVEAVVDNPTPFVGQQITYIVRFYTAVELSPSYESPDFEGFWRVDVPPFPFVQSSQQVNNRTYQVIEIRTALYPTRAGSLSIAPAYVVLPETVFRPAERLSSDAVNVQVQSLPAGAPVGFNGAVGQFNLTATLNRQSVILGEPLTLKLTLSGTGNVEQLSPPEVPAPEGWQIFTNPSTYTVAPENGSMVGQQVFEWVLVPNQTGPQVLPAATWIYFDPSRLAYRTLTTTPITLEVLPGADSSNLVVATPDSHPSFPASELLPLKPLPAVLTSEGLEPGWGFWLLWLLPPMGAIVSFGWMERQRRRHRDQASLRRTAALKRARARLRAAGKAAPKAAYRQMEQAIYAYFDDKLAHSPRRLDLNGLQRVMDSRALPPAVAARVLACLEWANEGQYAPVNTVDVRQLVQQTLETLAQVDVAWGTE